MIIFVCKFEFINCFWTAIYNFATYFGSVCLVDSIKWLWLLVGEKIAVLNVSPKFLTHVLASAIVGLAGALVGISRTFKVCSQWTSTNLRPETSLSTLDPPQAASQLRGSLDIELLYGKLAGLASLGKNFIKYDLPDLPDSFLSTSSPISLSLDVCHEIPQIFEFWRVWVNSLRASIRSALLWPFHT